MPVQWLDEIGAEDLDTVGGKSASLGELTSAGLPVPPGFVVTADTYRDFIEESGIERDLIAGTDVDSDDSEALAAAQERAYERITGTPMPDAVREEILEAYRSIGTDDEEAFVAVRSSATAEDLPDASFAGQQETFLNVREERLLDRVKECWASLFSRRAIHYRDQKGFEHREVDAAVVVQRMVDAETAGVMFTSRPTTGEPQVVVEAAWGLGAAVVSGAVSPDTYVVDRATGEVVEAAVADKKVMHVRDEAAGETVEADVPEDRREKRVLSEEELRALVDLGERIEGRYGTPQDVEWAAVDGEIYVLQSRPITTIPDDTTGDYVSDGDATGGTEPVRAAGDVIHQGLGASPGIASGTVRIAADPDQLDSVAEGDVLVTETTTPDAVPAMERAAGIVTDEGGMISHAAIVARELDLPAVVGCGSATGELSNDQVVTVDGDRGTVHRGKETEVVDEGSSESID